MFGIRGDPGQGLTPVNQLKRALKGELGKSKLSVRVLADALLKLFKLAELAGYRIEFRLRKKSAA